MQRNQIKLNDLYTSEKNEEFLEALYNSEELKNVTKWFDKLDCSVSCRREKDPDRTLDNFLDLMSNSPIISLGTGSSYPEDIRYNVRVSDSQQYIERFAWIVCPYNKHNYAVISELFENVYGVKLDSLPVSDVLKQYHESLGLSD